MPEPRDSAVETWLRAAGRGWLPHGLALVASVALGSIAIQAVLARAGHPALPLDDAFIHLQYARRLAEGSFYGYVPGAGYTTGATSPIWPLLLAPFHRLGLRDLDLIWAVWAFGTLAHAALAVETGRVAHRLAGPVAAIGAALMSLSFGAFAWFAWSGMETVPLAWVLMRTVRVASSWCEAEPGAPARRRRVLVEIVALGLLAPLVRPEGVIASVIAAIALATHGSSPRGRLLAAAPLLGPLLVPLTNLALAGHAASSTTTVKWLVGNPYFPLGDLVAAVTNNVTLLTYNLLDGGPWTAVFLPEGSAAPILLGLVAVVWMGRKARAPHRALFVLLVAAGTLLPCTYLSFLWNRVRYIWPFAGAWIVGVACLAIAAADAAKRIHPRLALLGPLLLGLAAFALATKLPWALSDLATSARAIDRQQVTLGRWAAEHLPGDARIGVNDTGAIAYESGRRTFDVVGLTTEGEAGYWAAGAGSRFEHYEQLPRAQLPTHFIVYPQWMACPAVLGDALTEATVLDQSILGGVTMVAYEARYDLLGTGALPSLGAPLGPLLDELDVSDLGSERAHRYELGPGASDQSNIAAVGPSPAAWEAGDDDADTIADGGRVRRTIDRFELKPSRASLLVMRVSAEEPVVLVVTAAGRELATLDIPASPWVERAVPLPDLGDAPVAITITARDGLFGAFHYWLFER